VTLHVLDVSGRIVRTLLAGESEPAGRSQLTWDGKNNAGRNVAAGTYFCRLETRGESETQRLVFIR